MKTQNFRIPEAVGDFLNQTVTAINENKVWFILTVLFSISVQEGFAQDFSQTQQSIKDQATNIYKLLSIIIGAAALFFIGKNILEGLKGDQGAWQKLGGIVLAACIWFFAVPEVIKWIFSQAATKQTF